MPDTVYCDGCYQAVTTTNNGNCPTCLTDFFLYDSVDEIKDNPELWEHELHSNRDN